MEMEKFATADWPLRASALTRLCWCPGFLILDDERLETSRDSVGAAAQTGTAVDRMVTLFHAGYEVRDALKQARSERDTGSPDGGHPYPQADMGDAEFMFRRYCEDPRNPQDIVLAETQQMKLRLELPPAPEDLTGQPVIITGHPDQVRRDPQTGQLTMWDLKAGKPGGLQMIYEYCWQLSAYTLAASHALGEDVQPGGIIRLRGYKTKGRTAGEATVFYHAAWTLEDCRDFMSTVCFNVAHIRNGAITCTPGIYCQWCPGDGPQNCGQAFDDAFKYGLLT